MRRVRALYGASPLGLPVLLASFAIATAAVIGWSQRPRDVAWILLWFAAAIVAHDLVVLPLYSLADRLLLGPLAARARRRRPRTFVGRVNATPYLRIPALLTLLLLAVFFPVIFGLGANTELSASGIREHGYLARWALASGAMFGLSGLVWVVAVVRRGLRRGAGWGEPVAVVASVAPVVEPVGPVVSVPVAAVVEAVPPAVEPVAPAIEPVPPAVEPAEFASPPATEPETVAPPPRPAPDPPATPPRAPTATPVPPPRARRRADSPPWPILAAALVASGILVRAVLRRVRASRSG